ncbi:hypothetical protein [Burkholderia sp. Bp8998]|uniref:hypothetical protein n=1 Tax=Burkholderia sp. Bp8998 TaxID=2184557 RepID=UPI000F598714|nr:hypothetical protein [Burkholderia sp. Bp8998]
MEIRTRRTIQASLLLLAFSGCTTAKIVGDAGKQFENGNIFMGLYEGTIGVTVGLITDVVTLGGTATPEQGTQTILSAAGKSTPVMSNSYLDNTSSASVTGASQSTANSPTESRNVKTTLAVKGCVGQAIVDGGMYAGSQVAITNKCSFPIRVSWCVVGARGSTLGETNFSGECSHHYTGMYELQPGEKSSLQIAGFRTLQSIACKSPYEVLQPVWNGDNFNGPCVFNP